MATENVNKDVNTENVVDLCVRSTKPTQSVATPSRPNKPVDDLSEVLDLSLKHIPVISTSASSSSSSSSSSPKDQHLVSSTVASPRDKYPNVSVVGTSLATSSSPSKFTTFGRKSPKESPLKASTSGLDGKGTSKTVQSYKATHPIGSRKVTENVITYHEPMFQSVVNCLFEKRQSEQQQIVGKRKVGEKCGEEKFRKSEDGSPDAKKFKMDSPPKTNIKKKVSIEHIVDRIRTQTKAASSSNDVPVVAKSLDKILVIEQNVNTIKAEPVAEVAAQSSTDGNKCEPSGTNDNKNFTKLVESPATTVNKQSETPDSTSEGTEFLMKSEKKKSGTKSSVKDRPAAKVKKKQEKYLDEEKQRVKRPYKKREKVFELIDGKNVLKAVKKIKTGLSTKDKGEETKKKQGGKTSKTGVKEGSSSKDETKPKKGRKPSANKQTKKKIQPVFVPRKKREASLNAAMLVNIMYEKSPPKSMTKRSKSESDISAEPKQVMGVSHSCSELKVSSDLTNNTKEDFTSPSTSPSKSYSGSPIPKSALKRQISNMEDDVFQHGKGGSMNECVSSSPSSPKKLSPKRKISFQDEVIKWSANSMNVSGNRCEQKEGKDTNQTKNIKTKGENQNEGTVIQIKKDKQKDLNLKKKSEQLIEAKKNKKIVKLTSEEIEERKRKSNLARLKKAKEIIRAKKLIKKKQSNGSSSSCSESDSSHSDTVNKDSDEQCEADVKTNRTKKGALQRAARTHVSVEQKNMYENVSTSPKWCECCQSTYSYPSQSQPGTKFWGLRELVDRGSSEPPTQIQSSSQHMVAAHSSSSCEVRPYGSPSHVSMIDSAPFVGQLMPHGHMGCTACGCGHSGMLHTTQCQNYPLGGVGNLLSCQHYSNSYSVPYPHSSYAHCGCASTYHHPGSHAAGQPLLHQSNIAKETPILVHRPVQLQVSHDSSHAVSLPGPLQITHTVSDSSHLQGEITNVSVARSNSLSDQEYIDVGGDDVIRNSGSFPSSLNSKLSSTNKPVKTKNLPATKQVFVKVKKCSSDMDLKNDKQSKFDLKVKLKGSDVKKKKEKSLKSKTVEFNIISTKDGSKQKPAGKHKASKPKVKQADKFYKQQKAFEEKRRKAKKLKKEAKAKKDGKVKKEKAKKPVKEEEKELLEEKKAPHGWNWHGEGIVKQVTNIFDGQLIQRKCFSAIQHEDGDVIHVKDCILVCSGRKKKDLPYVAKIGNFFEDPATGEMMMTILWFYRPEHTDGGRKPEQLENEVFAAKHRDETLVACIEDRGYVLTYNEFCRFSAEVQRHKYGLLPRKKVVPDSEEEYPSGRIPPVDSDPDTVFLCRQVYDIKLKRVLKNPV